MAGHHSCLLDYELIIDSNVPWMGVTLASLARYIDPFLQCLLTDYSGRLAESDEGEA